MPLGLVQDPFCNFFSPRNGDTPQTADHDYKSVSKYAIGSKLSGCCVLLMSRALLVSVGLHVFTAGTMVLGRNALSDTSKVFLKFDPTKQ